MTLTNTSGDSRIRPAIGEITHSPDMLTLPPDTTLDVIGIDSVGMIDLLYKLEEVFGIQIPDDDVTPENFASIASLTDMVQRKCGS